MFELHYKPLDAEEKSIKVPLSNPNGLNHYVEFNGQQDEYLTGILPF